MSLLFLLFSSCELISLLQMVPESVTRISGRGIDLSEIFGVYEIYSEDDAFQMRYVENLNHRYLAIDCYRSASGKPQSVVVDVDKWEVVREFNQQISVSTLSLSVKLTAALDYDFFSDREQWDPNFSWIAYNGRPSTENHLILFDAPNNTLRTALNGGFVSNQVYNETGLVTATATTRDGTDTTGGNITLSVPAEFYMVRNLTDPQTLETIYMGFTSGSEIYAYSGVYTTATITPVSLGYSDYTDIGDYNRPYHFGAVFYSRKGWIKLEPGSVLPHFRLYDLDTGAKLDKPSLPSGLYAAMDFSYSGKEFYYIDLNSIKLFTATTGW